MSGEYDDPYDPNTKDYQNETPGGLDIVLMQTIDEVLKNIHTALPGKVVSVTATGLVGVQPLIKRMYKDGKAVDLPVIQGCPIIQPRGNGYFIKLPVKVGDTGLVLFTERSIDKWMVSGGSIDPQDSRKFDLSDGVFIPGMYPMSSPIPDATTDLIISNAGSQVRVKETGEVDVVASTKISLQHALAAVLSEPMMMGTTTQTVLATLLQNAIDTQTQLNTLALMLATVLTAEGAHTHNIITPVPGNPTGPPTTAAGLVAGGVTATTASAAIIALQTALATLKSTQVDSGAILSALGFVEK